MSKPRRFAPAAVQSFIASGFARVGLPEDDAETIAALMTDADMQGSDGLSSDLVQVDIRAKSAQSALDVRAVVIAKLHSLSCVQGATDFRLIALRADRGVQFEKTDTASYFTALLEFDVYSRAAG